MRITFASCRRIGQVLLGHEAAAADPPFSPLEVN
jgi:hypothetical protein